MLRSATPDLLAGNIDKTREPAGLRCGQNESARPDRPWSAENPAVARCEQNNVARIFNFKQTVF